MYHNVPKTPEDTGAVKPNPGFKPLSDGTKGAFVGGYKVEIFI
jgi:hypothetical protein